MRVFRYPLEITDRQILTVPMSAVVLSVGQSREDPKFMVDMWVRVPEVAPDVQIVVYIIGTGNLMPEELNDYSRARFIGTVVTSADQVYHVFAGPER